MGNVAFGNNELTEIEIPKTLTIIPTGAFSKNQLTSVTMPEGVTMIGISSFKDNKLENVIIPTTVENIRATAFSQNDLKNVIIPERTKEIGKNAFSKNKNIKLTYSKLLKAIESGQNFKVNGKSEEKVEKLQNSIKAAEKLNEEANANLEDINKAVDDVNESIYDLIDEKDFNFINGKITEYVGSEKDVIIPDTIEGETVTSIGSKAFRDKKLTSVKLPESITIIEDKAFEKNNLKSINLPEGLTYIGAGAFSSNELSSVQIPKNIKEIPMASFSKNNLKSVIISNGVTSVGLGAFKGNKIESLNIPDTVTNIGKMAFQENELNYIKLSKNTEIIEVSSFTKNKLTEVNIPEGVKIIGDAAFRENNLETVNLSSTVERIGDTAFNGNKLSKVIIPTNIKQIGNEAFTNNNEVKLEYLKLVQAINAGKSINLEGKAEEKVKNLKLQIEKAKEINEKVYATVEEVNEVVKNLENAIKLLNEDYLACSIKEIKHLQFNNVYVTCGTTETDLKEKLQKQVTIIDSNNTEHNLNINWSILDYNENVEGEYIASGSFELPKGMNQANPPIKLKVTTRVIVSSKEWNKKDFLFKGTTIAGFSDKGKEKLKNNKDVVIPTTNDAGQPITEIGDKAFLGTYESKQNPEKGINTVKIPDTVTTIGLEAFRYNCLSAIEIPSSVTTIKQSAFNGNKIKSLVIPDTIKNLEDGAFTLNKIENLTLPNTLKVIPKAFAFNKLKTLVIPEGVTKIEMLAFSDNLLTEVKLPSTLKYLSGFNNNNFRSIEIPKTVTELGEKAFASNKMTSVTIPGNVKVVGSRAFWNTWHDQFLTSVNIEEGVEKIDEYAFASNQLKDVNLPSSLKELSYNAFSTNLGYDGIVYLFIKDYKNQNNLKESKYSVINPAKLTIKYVYEDKVLKEEALWKNPKTEEYFHIGDKAVKIQPNYDNNEYEVINKNEISVDLNDKDNECIINCNKKDLIDKITIKSIGEVPSQVVDFGTEKNSVIEKLSKIGIIIDSNDNKHKVTLNWTMDNYDANKSGKYVAIGRFKLPEGVNQTEPEMKLEVKAEIVVKEQFENIDNDKWSVEDFNFSGTTIKGFSEIGEEKLKNNKDLILPRVNNEGENITNVGEKAFYNKGLVSLKIPEGMNGLVIQAGAFQENKLSKVFIPEGVEEILTFAFYKNDLTYVDFPGSVRKIGNQAFADNKLISMTIDKGEGTICLDCFSFLNNQISSVTILKDVKKIHKDAFKNNKGSELDENKVQVFVAKLDHENNGLFETSQYHRINLLSIESIEELKPIVIEVGTKKEDIGLYEKMKLKLNNGDIKEVKTAWICEEYDANKLGEYNFKAIYDLPQGLELEKQYVNVKVIIKEKLNDNVVVA